MNKRSESGSIVIILVALLAVAGIGFVVWQGMSNKSKTSAITTACPTPVFGQSPTDISKVTTILYPGQTRGGHYKPHGGFGFADGANTQTVVAPMSGHLKEGARYIEQGEVQYLFEIENDCGISYRFDHLLTLSDRFKVLINALPEPKPDDSRTTPYTDKPDIAAGEVIATAVGFSKTGNAGFDFGVYDHRQPNEASKNADYAAKHQQDKQQSFYAVCWFDLLPAADAAIVKALPARDAANGKTSDYCK